MEDVNTLVGRGSHFEGKLTFEGVVRIDGSFEGEIASADTLVIGEGAEVHAEIDVASLVVHGSVHGNVRASESVELHAPARLMGNIVSPSLLVERGSTFDGNCRMGAGSGEPSAEAGASGGSLGVERGGGASASASEGEASGGASRSGGKEG